MKRKFISVAAYIILAVLFLILIVLGTYVYRYDSISFINRLKAETTTYGLFRTKANQNDLKLNSDSTFVIMVFGQSNSANSSTYYYRPIHKIYNFYNGNFYIAKEPLLGRQSGLGGSVWTMLGDKLIDAHLCNNVIFVPIGIGGTKIELWDSGYCHKILINTLKQLQQKKIKLTHIIWHQGEANSRRTTENNYKNHLLNIFNTVRQYGQTAPIYCSIASYTPSDELISTKDLDSNITNAQKEVINSTPNVLAGPDTDSLILGAYRNGPHFTKTGLEAFSSLLLNAIKDSSEIIKN
ncbi:hypothetical protein A9P82_11405 [Arachidicoccus ginsenosidimutans]|uniref:sialate O-acetylesterase n=1 Tax=Arachidicoccus sp. BS20 TaxID=1850526 RepID=UPI0007F0756C|nr:sialate O-acetylesterase [Arachidicoccus sp. BS20]ANI89839.1 hypothetical protein A9P82_11405 [Arachidicoccus sp. BS20]